MPTIQTSSNLVDKGTERLRTSELASRKCTCDYVAMPGNSRARLEWTEPNRCVGFWSGCCAAIIGLAFVVVGVIGVAARPPSADPLRQVDPYLAILETLMILFAVMLIAVFAALHVYAPAERKAVSLTSLAFTICFAILTCALHFASLTLGRRIDADDSALLSRQLSFAEWPTLAMSLDLLAWDFFLGLALVFAAEVFKGEAHAQVRVALLVAGTLCLLGTLGPVSGHLYIQYLGIMGYAFALPIGCALLARLFQRPRTSEAD